jgi:hypothetical protein
LERGREINIAASFLGKKTRFALKDGLRNPAIERLPWDDDASFASEHEDAIDQDLESNSDSDESLVADPAWIPERRAAGRSSGSVNQPLAAAAGSTAIGHPAAMVPGYLNNATPAQWTFGTAPNDSAMVQQFLSGTSGFNQRLGAEQRAPSLVADE